MPLKIQMERQNKMDSDHTASQDHDNTVPDLRRQFLLRPMHLKTGLP